MAGIHFAFLRRSAPLAFFGMRQPAFLAIAVAVLLVGWNHSAFAQFPFEFPNSVDEMMEGFFRLSPEQRAELRDVEVPIRSEREFGEQVLQSYRKQIRLQGLNISNQGTDSRYLSQLVGRIKPLMVNRGRYSKIEVHVVDSSEVDARSIPGGILIFYRGLLEFAENEAALAGIVGHELSHLDRRHQLKPLQQQLVAQKKFQSATVRPSFDLGDFFDFGKLSLNSYHPFHPEEEAEADRDAVVWLHQLGYQPLELAKLFQRLSQLNQGIAAQPPAFLRTHPAMRDRSAEVTRLAADLQKNAPKANLVVGHQALAQRSPAPLGNDKAAVKRGRR